jgi:hypothetical protein
MIPLAVLFSTESVIVGASVGVLLSSLLAVFIGNE